MSRRTWNRAIAALAAVASMAAIAPAAAQACSCVPNRDLTADLGRGQVAVIGEVVAEQRIAPPTPPQPPVDPDAPAPEPSSPGAKTAYTVRVERAFNAAFGAEVVVMGGGNSSSCGFTWSIGQRVGALLYNPTGEWGTSSCGLVTPEALIAAADTPPVQPPVQPTPPQPPTPVDPQPERETEAAPALRARVGSHVALGGARADSGLQRLPARAGQRVRLRLDAAARGLRVAPARADGKRLGRLLTAREITGSRGTGWAVRLPRTLPARTARLLVAVDYGSGRRAVFAVALGRPAPAKAANASVAAGLPCPALPAPPL